MYFCCCFFTHIFVVLVQNIGVFITKSYIYSGNHLICLLRTNPAVPCMYLICLQWVHVPCHALFSFLLRPVFSAHSSICASSVCCSHYTTKVKSNTPKMFRSIEIRLKLYLNVTEPCSYISCLVWLICTNIYPDLEPQHPTNIYPDLEPEHPTNFLPQISGPLYHINCPTLWCITIGVLIYLVHSQMNINFYRMILKCVYSMCTITNKQLVVIFLSIFHP